jgi:hypothetical protein
VYHVALWVPALVFAVAVDLDELFQDGGLTTDTLVRKADRVVVVAVCLSAVELLTTGRDVTGPERLVALGTD